MGFALGVPALIRRYWRYHVTALVLVLAAAVLAWAVVSNVPESYSLFVNDALAGGRDPFTSRETLAKTLHPEGTSLEEGSAFAAFLFIHNTQVAFLALSLGMLLALPTIYLLVSTGLMLGAFTAVFTGAGLGTEFFAWLLPHAVPELGSVILCGGAGLAVGHRMLNPGALPRMTMLRRTAADAAVTAMGCVPLLFLAGMIEGIFRQSEATTTMRYTLFGFLAAAFGAWIFFARRTPVVVRETTE